MYALSDKWDQTENIKHWKIRVFY